MPDWRIEVIRALLPVPSDVETDGNGICAVQVGTGRAASGQLLGSLRVSLDCLPSNTTPL